MKASAPVIDLRMIPASEESWGSHPRYLQANTSILLDDEATEALGNKHGVEISMLVTDLFDMSIDGVEAEIRGRLAEFLRRAAEAIEGKT